MRLALVLAAAAAFGANPPLGPPLWVDADTRAVPKPKRQGVSELYAIVYNSWLRHLNLEDKVLAARDSGALNVSAWDEVPDSSWFNNRMGRRLLPPEELGRGLE